MLAFLILILVCVVTSVSNVRSQTDLHSLQIEANVPNKKEFDPILTRDLVKYFSDIRDIRREELKVQYELLRPEPTQSGVAYPKFYLWIKVSMRGQLAEEGAARVAAIEKKKFDVTDYLRREDIRR